MGLQHKLGEHEYSQVTTGIENDTWHTTAMFPKHSRVSKTIPSNYREGTTVTEELPRNHGYRKRYPALSKRTSLPSRVSKTIPNDKWCDIISEVSPLLTGIENDTQHSQNAHLFLHGYRKRYPAPHNDTPRTTLGIENDTQQPLLHKSSVADSSFLINIAPKWERIGLPFCGNWLVKLRGIAVCSAFHFALCRAIHPIFWAFRRHYI